MSDIHYLDAHVHLQDARLDADLTEILVDCRHSAIAGWVVNGTSEADWPRVRALASAHPDIAPSFGLHPWNVASRSAHWLSTLEHELQQGAVGVGEIGLDRWIRGHDIEDQRSVFLDQLALATKYHLPASIHCLKAWGHLLQCLQSSPLPSQGFLLHSYGGPREMIAPLAELGAYFSLSGHFFHERKHAQLDALLHIVPKDRLLLETDAPDMALPEHKQQPFNHPKNLTVVYARAAEALDEPIEQLAQRLSDNFQRLFSTNYPDSFSPR